MALEGFPLNFVTGKDLPWLSRVIKVNLEYSIPEEPHGPERMSNAQIRQALNNMENSIGSTLEILQTRGYEIDLHLLSVASDYIDNDGPTRFGFFMNCIQSMNECQEFLRLALNELDAQRGPWRQSLQKYYRISRAQSLAAIYEAAFGQPVSANNYPNDSRHKSPTPFMDFYFRMVKLAFGSRETSNWTEVVKEACLLHRKHPDQFDESIIADL